MFTIINPLIAVAIYFILRHFTKNTEWSFITLAISSIYLAFSGMVYIVFVEGWTLTHFIVAMESCAGMAVFMIYDYRLKKKMRG